MRKKRRQRRVGSIPQLRILPCDEVILELLSEFRYLTADLIQPFIGATNKRNISLRLERLQAAGLLHFYDSEIPLPLNWPDPVYLNKASKKLKQAIDLPYIPSSSFFAHDFQLCRYVASLYGQAQKDTIPFTTRRHLIKKGLQLSSPISHTFDDGQTKKSKKPTRPDDIIRIFNSNYAVELEHGNPKEPTTDIERASVFRKILCYKSIAKNKTYEELGLTNLRVIFVFPTEAAMNTAINLVLTLIGPTNLFLFTTMNYAIGSPVPHLLYAPYKRAGLDDYYLVKT